MITGHTHVASAGVLAAELLAEACGTGNGLRAETVRDLAEDLGSGLSSLPNIGTADSLVEAALACADLATLAACNNAGLGGPSAVAAAHLAAGATPALAAPPGAQVGGPRGGHAENAPRGPR